MKDYARRFLTEGAIYKKFSEGKAALINGSLDGVIRKMIETMRQTEHDTVKS